MTVLKPTNDFYDFLHTSLLPGREATESVLSLDGYSCYFAEEIPTSSQGICWLRRPIWIEGIHQKGRRKIKLKSRMEREKGDEQIVAKHTYS